MKRLALALAILSQCALPTDPHIVFTIDTDAPLPEGDPAIPALFDRLAVEVYEPNASIPCRGCTREFALTTDLLKTRHASFGIAVRPSVAGYRVHARLFRARDSAPPPDAALESWVALPIVEDGAVNAHVTLHTDDAGLVLGTMASPIPAESGKVDTSAVGTWRFAKRVPCPGPLRSDEVCIPGGAFWMGNRAFHEGPDSRYASDQERIVVVSPFALQKHEVTVGEWRAWPKHGTSLGSPWSGSSAGLASPDFCTYWEKDTTRDSLPIDCVSWTHAREYCTDRGGDLPTEAQFEYAASGLRGDPFVWGNDQPTCADAIYGLGGWLVTDYFGSTTCRMGDARGGPRASNPSRKDALRTPDGDVTDLAGNLTEWTRDAFEDQGGTCWTARLTIDPFCQAESTLKTLRGGNWQDSASNLRAARRIAENPDYFDFVYGFRCVRDLK